MPVGTPLPNGTGTFERCDTLRHQIQVMQGIDLPLAVSEYSRMLGHFLLIGIEAHLLTGDVCPEPPTDRGGAHGVRIPLSRGRLGSAGSAGAGVRGVATQEWHRE